MHVWKKLQSIINPPKHNISKNNGRILLPSRWKKMKSTPTLKKWPFFKVRKKALVVVGSSKFKLNKKISLKICNFYLYDIFRGPFLHLEKCTCRCKVFFGPPCIDWFYCVKLNKITTLSGVTEHASVYSSYSNRLESRLVLLGCVYSWS